MKIEINAHAYHKDVYDGNQEMKIVGIRENQVELEGDFSGGSGSSAPSGTHHTVGKAWFPKEGLIFETKEEPLEITQDDTTETNNLIYETPNVMFRSIQFVNSDGSFGSVAAIEFTDKRPEKRKNWVEHYLDNENFFFGILDNDVESIKSALEIMHQNQLKDFKQFIQYLFKNNRLRKPIQKNPIYPMFLKRPSDNQLFKLHEETQLYKSFPWLDESKPYPQFNYQTLIEHYGFIPCDSLGNPLIS